MKHVINVWQKEALACPLMGQAGLLPAVRKAIAFTLLVMCPVSIAAVDSESVSQCVHARIDSSGDEVTLGQLRSACRQALDAALDDVLEPPRRSVAAIRREANFDNRSRPFSISPYRANYILFTHNDDPNEEPYQVEPTDFLEKEELKFQVSFKMPVATGLFDTNTDLLFAYTSVAWWQATNDDIANPFRETNYEPEIFLRNHTLVDLPGVDLVSWELGLNHQSNGRSEPESRGWDRAIGGASFELNDDLVLGLHAWGILDTQDTNSNIEDYLGYGDVGLAWAPNRNTFSMKWRPSSNGNAVELNWSYPISSYMRIYAQYWNGHGESLVDYDFRTERVGIGIALNDVVSRD